MTPIKEQQTHLQQAWADWWGWRKWMGPRPCSTHILLPSWRLASLLAFQWTCSSAPCHGDMHGIDYESQMGEKQEGKTKAWSRVLALGCRLVVPDASDHPRREHCLYKHLRNKQKTADPLEKHLFCRQGRKVREGRAPDWARVLEDCFGNVYNGVWSIWCSLDLLSRSVRRNAFFF